MDSGSLKFNDSFHQSTSPSSLSSSPSKNEQHQEALALKKALEWELTLDSRDLRSHAWYHGPLSRQRAEEIVQREGDFLIRDCTSQPNNYVLTCRTKTAALHFVINKILVQPETVYERVQYQFEEEAFDAIPDLITFYVGAGKIVSQASGARIQYPCNRTYPLSFYGHKIVGNQLHAQMLTGSTEVLPLNSPLPNKANFRFTSSTLTTNISQSMTQLQKQSSPMSSPPRTALNSFARLHAKKPRSQSLTPAQALVVSNITKADNENTSIQNAGSNRDISEHARNTCISGNSLININVSQTQSNGFCTDLVRGIKFDTTGNLSSQETNSLHLHLENLQLNGKFPNNGFQTIARCTTSDLVEHHFKFTTHSLPRPASTAYRNILNRTSSLARDLTSDISNNTFSNMEFQGIPEVPEKAPSPPPKPNRSYTTTIPQRRDKETMSTLEQQYALHRAGVYQLSGSDSGNGSGDSMPGDTNEFLMQRGVVIKNPRFMASSTSSSTLKSLTEFNIEAAEKELFILDIPEIKVISKFDVENFSTLLLPSVENKPLDGDALNTFKIMLAETGPKLLAEHITRIDIGLLIEDPLEQHQLTEMLDEEQNFLQCCGLEMLTLPHGGVFRKDLIERTQCMKLIVAVTILTCQTDLDRAEILSKWIQIAVETKTALGNLYGFSNIMLGLCMIQIQKLDTAWHILRQKYTDDAFMFEAKLRPTFINMNECLNPQAPNTTVPHVLLYALLKDRPIVDILNVNNPNKKSSLFEICIMAWESKADDFGMFINYQHLDSSRSFLSNLQLYRKNSKLILEDANSRLDELLSDIFRTEFHIKFLWGSKGAATGADDRHSKLEKVLGLMADKFCNTENSS